MKMTDRIKRNMKPDKPMTLISLRLPDHVIEDLKEVAPSLGFGGYQALIRAYISNGLRKHLAEREARGSSPMACQSRPSRKRQRR
jgi:hypothetical protein